MFPSQQRRRIKRLFSPIGFGCDVGSDPSQSRHHVPPFCMSPKVYNSAATIAAAVRTWFQAVHRLT